MGDRAVRVCVRARACVCARARVCFVCPRGVYAMHRTVHMPCTCRVRMQRAAMQWHVPARRGGPSRGPSRRRRTSLAPSPRATVAASAARAPILRQAPALWPPARGPWRWKTTAQRPPRARRRPPRRYGTGALTPPGWRPRAWPRQRRAAHRLRLQQAQRHEGHAPRERCPMRTTRRRAVPRI